MTELPGIQSTQGNRSNRINSNVVLYDVMNVDIVYRQGVCELPEDSCNITATRHSLIIIHIHIWRISLLHGIEMAYRCTSLFKLIQYTVYLIYLDKLMLN